MDRRLTKLPGESWLQGRVVLPLLEKIGAGSEGVVLDLGCGDSPWADFFVGARRFLRFDRYQVDSGVTVVENVYELPLESGSVDVVLVSRMLGDVPDLRALFGEVSRVLAPEGLVVVFEAITYPQHDLPDDYWRVLPGGLRFLCEGAGMSVREVHYCGGYGTQIALHVNKFILGAVESRLRLGPVCALGRVCVNLSCMLLDRIWRRPTLASDYVAVVSKSAVGDAS